MNFFYRHTLACIPCRLLLFIAIDSILYCAIVATLDYFDGPCFSYILTTTALVIAKVMVVLLVAGIQELCARW